MKHLVGWNCATDPRYVRRPLTPDEAARLVACAEAGPDYNGMSGPDRAMLYRVALGTGFRRNELRSLTRESFLLDDDPPAIVLKAMQAKNRKETRQPIRPDLAKLLRSWLSTPVCGRVFGHMPDRTAQMLKTDLATARAAWIQEAPDAAEREAREESDFLATTDAEGRRVDLHSLRQTFITELVRAGVPVKVAQQLARHSDPKLTLNVYTRLGVDDLAGALDALPTLASDERGRGGAREAGGAPDTDSGGKPPWRGRKCGK